MIHLTTVNVDGRAEDDVCDCVDVDVADAAVLLDELAQVDAVGVPKLLLHAPHQGLDAVVVLQEHIKVQGWTKRRSPVKFITALAYHSCLALPAAFTQPGNRLIAKPCTVV